MDGPMEPPKKPLRKNPEDGQPEEFLGFPNKATRIWRELFTQQPLDLTSLTMADAQMYLDITIRSN